MLPVIFGLEGLTLSPQEESFFARVRPLGFILFDRNVRDPQQLRRLTQQLRACVGNEKAPILIDQEGGRIQRLWPPYWESLPFASTYGDFWEDKGERCAVKGVQKHAKTLAKMLLKEGIDTDCWPCLDVACEKTAPVLRKRFFSDRSERVERLAHVAADTMLHYGLRPVIKHIPGYGRAQVDPHGDLPVVKASLKDLERDFSPFRSVPKGVWGMTAHVLYTVLDKKYPATLSEKVIRFIRENIGFKGFLITDDMSMGALSGDAVDNVRQALKAGCDAVCICKPDLSEMKKIARALPEMTAEQVYRALNRKDWRV